MNCHTARDAFPALLDRRTDPADHAEERRHLAQCPDCQRDYAALSEMASALDTLPTPAPTERMRKNFFALLEAEKRSLNSAAAAAHPGPVPRRRPAYAWWLGAPALAAALLTIGFLAGTRYAPPAVEKTAPVADATQVELRQLREQVNKMGQLVGYSLLQQQSPANDRLREVLASANVSQPNDKTLDDLIAALAFDPSANVRLRALEALSPHAASTRVRAGVLAALPREQNPLIQLELIDFIAETHDRSAAPALETLAQNDTLDRSVREAAQRALAQF